MTMATRSMATRVPIVGGNWKMNAGKGTTGESVDTLVSGLNSLPQPKCEVYIAPPAIYLDKVNSAVSPTFMVSSQNIYKTTDGAFTGETSAEMLMDMGVSYTLIGHSERRDIFGETDELLGAKIAHAMDVGMTVIACIGEHQADREAGTTMDVLVPQLQAIVDNTTDYSKLVIAYEPVWAIGTGLTATPEQAQETHANIRTWLAGAAGAEVADGMRIQYGGSANDKNCHDLAAGEDVDGFLVGGACLASDSFGVILATFD